MRSLFIDLYAIAFNFCSKISPNRGAVGAALYASNICLVALFILVVLGFELATAALGIPAHRLIGKSSLIPLVITVVMLTFGNKVTRMIVRSIDELQAPESVRARYASLSNGRKWLVLGTVIGSFLSILFIVAVRQFFGAFGGM